MIAKVSVAKSDSDIAPAPECFQELNDIYIDESRVDVGKDGSAKLFVEVADKLTRPLVMAAEREPKVTCKIWNFETHDFGTVKFDFGNGRYLWLRIGMFNWEFDERGNAVT